MSRCGSRSGAGVVAPRGPPRGAQDGDDGETDEERADAALRDGVGAERDGDRRPGDRQRDPGARTVGPDLVDVGLAGLFGRAAKMREALM